MEISIVCAENPLPFGTNDICSFCEREMPSTVIAHKLLGLLVEASPCSLGDGDVNREPGLFGHLSVAALSQPR